MFKPLPVNLVQQWILQALVGHRDMEIAGIANGDQNLRNILWDKENQQIKFVDMGYACQQTCWNNHTFNCQNIEVSDEDALEQELTHFCRCIMNNNIDILNIKNAIKALDIAQRINKIIQTKKAIN